MNHPGKTSAITCRDLQNRIVALIDMDCFYVQVEQRLAPEWKGKPCAVVQYNEWKGGGIIAVGYEARAAGVSRRNMRGEDAREVCPDIKLFKVPEVRGKADLTRYREAGAEVIAVLSKFDKCIVERASIDEAYIDLTNSVQEMMSEEMNLSPDDLSNTYIVGSDDEDRERSVKDWLDSIKGDDNVDTYNERRLACGAAIVEKMRAAIKQQTGFNCSAGISHNKVLSKLACGLHKPQKQTILTIGSVGDLFATLPIQKVRHLGGKLGRRLMEDHGIQYMGDICNIDKKDLISDYGEKSGQFLYDLCRGHDPETITSRTLVQSVGCSKNFRGPTIITDYSKARRWLSQLAAEMEERLIKDREQNRRVSKNLSLSVRFTDWQSLTRAIPINRYSQQAIETSAMAALTKICGEGVTSIQPAINCLGLSAGKFEDIGGQTLTSFFRSGKASDDIFDQLEPSPKKSNQPSNSHKGIAAFTSKANLTDPFESLSKPESVSPKKVKLKPAKGKKEAGIRSYTCNKPPDPFDKIAKECPRVYDEGIQYVHMVDNGPLLRHEVNLKSYLSTSTTKDPFDSLKVNPQSSKQQSKSLKTGWFAANGKPSDPFDSVESPAVCKTPSKGIKRYLCEDEEMKSGDVEFNHFSVDSHTLDILDVSSDEMEDAVRREEPATASRESSLSDPLRGSPSTSSLSEPSLIDPPVHCDSAVKSSAVSQSATASSERLLTDLISCWDEKADASTDSEQHVSFLDAVEREQLMSDNKIPSLGLTEYANSHLSHCVSENSPKCMEKSPQLPVETQKSDISLTKKTGEGNNNLFPDHLHSSPVSQDKSVSGNHGDGEDDICVVWEADHSRSQQSRRSTGKPGKVANKTTGRKDKRVKAQPSIKDFFS